MKKTCFTFLYVAAFTIKLNVVEILCVNNFYFPTLSNDVISQQVKMFKQSFGLRFKAVDYWFQHLKL